jgi:hypothetical protein
MRAPASFTLTVRTDELVKQEANCCPHCSGLLCQDCFALPNCIATVSHATGSASGTAMMEIAPNP